MAYYIPETPPPEQFRHESTRWEEWCFSLFQSLRRFLSSDLFLYLLLSAFLLYGLLAATSMA